MGHIVCMALALPDVSEFYEFLVIDWWRAVSAHQRESLPTKTISRCAGLADLCSQSLSMTDESACLLRTRYPLHNPCQPGLGQDSS